MTRDFQIPLVLWVSAAIVVHILGGGGATATVLVAERFARDRADIRSMVREVRGEVRKSTVTELEIDVAPTPTEDLSAQEEIAASAAGQPPEDAKFEVPQKLAEKPKTPEQAKEEEAKKAEEAAEEAKKAEALVIPVAPDARIAVRQHAEKDQPDNPDAPRIADDANRVDEETMAKQRALDRDEKDPTPGTNNKGPSEAEGNADKTKVAQSEDRAGDPSRAPGSEPAAAAPPSVAPQPAGGGGVPNPGAPAQPAPPSVAALPSPGGAGPAAPELVSGADGTWSVDPANPGGDGRDRKPGLARLAPPPSISPRQASGLGPQGRAGAPPGLDWNMFEVTVGKEKLDKERVAAGQAMRSQHRGRFDTNKFERWRPAIENYDPSVKLGNQTALNAARVPFASYLHSIHNRLHPIFAEEFLDSLKALPGGHALSKMDLVTHVEVVLSRDEGKIVRMGITQNSESTIFDAVALESIERASPFGKAPDVIVSPDGHVYLHWEFHRDPYDACSTRNARPFLLNEPPRVRPNLPLRRRPPSRPGEAPRGDDAGDGPLLPLRRR